MDANARPTPRKKLSTRTGARSSAAKAPAPGKLASATAEGRMAMLIIDMISSWDFVDAEKLLPHAAAISSRIAGLKLRARAAGVPVIYANDNAGRWRSDFPSLIKECIAAGGAGARIAEELQPDEEDYFVLKPKQSAFFSTPLELLLRHLKADRLLLTGVASDQCILVTATEAVMRDLEVVVPKDCVASQTLQRNRLVLRQLDDFHKIPTTASTYLRLK